MRVKIYQIDADRDKDRLKFMSMQDTVRISGTEKIDPAIYDEVFNAELEENGPEDVFCRFNTEGHPLYRGHSLSVSDVVVMGGTAYFCDDMGFRKIPFDESQTRKPDNLMRVVYVEPHKPPYVAEIENTLEAEQKAVGGFIEPIYNEDDTCMVGNEEAKLIGLEGNRRIGNGSSILAGPFFVCGLTEDDFGSLTDEEVTKYMERFAEPEDISQKEVEADMGFCIYGL